MPISPKPKNTKRKLSPLVGESVSGADERGKSEQTRKKVSYKTAVNTCLSFLNGRKKKSGIEKPKSTGVSDGKRTVFQGTTRCCKVNEQTHENR